MSSQVITGSPPQAWVSGSDGPEKTQLRIGFMRLTDCAPLVMAAELGFEFEDISSNWRMYTANFRRPVG